MNSKLNLLSGTLCIVIAIIMGTIEIDVASYIGASLLSAAASMNYLVFYINNYFDVSRKVASLTQQESSNR